MIDGARLLWAVGAPISWGVLGAEAVSEEHVKVIVLLGGTIVGVVGAVQWVNAQVKSRIDEHATSDEERHQRVMDEIRHLRELLHLKLGLGPENGEPS